MANFSIKYGSVASISGSTEDWGVRTVGQAVNSERAKAALKHPSDVTIFVSDVQVTADHTIVDGARITLQKVANTKG